MNKRSETLQNIIAFAIVAVFATVFWDTFKTAVMFVVTLGVLVAIHEWGHFIAAKAVGVTVYEFALGFGPKLLTYMKRGGTDYTVRAFPLGGFVNPKGMQPDDPITPDGLNGRRPAERALVYLAGPLMNMILGVGILMFMGFLFGVPDESRVLVGEVQPKKPAVRLEVVSVDGQPVTDHPKGLRVGDRILAINDQPIRSRDEVAMYIHPHAGERVTITVQRKGKEIVLAGTPEARTLEERALVVGGVPQGTELGLKPGDQIDRIDGKHVGMLSEKESPEVAVRRYLQEKQGQQVSLIVWRNGSERLELEGPAGPVDVQIKEATRRIGVFGFAPIPGQGERVSLGQSLSNGGQYVQNFLYNIVGMFSRPAVLKESVGGPIAIGAILSQVDRLPLGNYFQVVASLSLSLAVFNMLPIPVLDGGHMTILAVEVLRRRRLEPETHKVVALMGLAIVGVLFVLIMSKDIMKYFG